MNNDTMKEIGEVLASAKSVLVFPHINVDGDALGSSVALAHTLREMSKECFVLMEDDIPENLRFLDKGYCTWDMSVIGEPEVCICLDCGELSRFPKRADVFKKGKTSVCVDHHRTSDPFCDHNYIDPESSSTGELVYELIGTMGTAVDKEAGEALYAAITTDTGNFQYSNTRAGTHRIVAELYDLGIDSYRVSVELYQNVRQEKVKLTARVMESMKLLSEGQIAVCRATQEMLRQTGAGMEETEGIIADLRNIRGVEIAVLLKEHADGKIKVSLRSKTYADVASIAAGLGGGGHIRAAGCTLESPIDEAEKTIVEAATVQLRQ